MLNKVKEDEEEEEHHRKQTPESKKNYESICKVLDAHTIKRLNAQVPEIQWQYQDYLFNKIEIVDDTSFGQRAFNKNV